MSTKKFLEYQALMRFRIEILNNRSSMSVKNQKSIHVVIRVLEKNKFEFIENSDFSEVIFNFVKQARLSKVNFDYIKHPRL